MRIDYEAGIGYYIAGSKWPVIWICVCGGLLLLCSLAILLLPKDAWKTDPSIAASVTLPQKILTGALGLSVLFVFFYRLPFILQNATFKGILMLVVLFGSAVFFGTDVFLRVTDARRVLAGLPLLIWLSFEMITRYTDMTVTMNHPVKRLTTVCLVAATLFQILQFHYTLSSPKPRLSLFLALSSTVLHLTLPIGLLIGGQTDLWKKELPLYLFFTVLVFWDAERFLGLIHTFTGCKSAVEKSAADSADSGSEEKEAN